ncbi:MAG: 16S rRNA (guanine(966)-N(2))-methyltransferase RsmD [Planctomycetes bacterium]|nr:16S rRNA (guanine(966)-N(2))-methyltransferase RsmD [Planctomycetota bacterium]
MRIIAGKKRGMKLLSPKTQGSRPIIDRVKESLFSVLFKYDLPNGKMVADVFSGVGSLGLEALSRGAEFVTFVEKDPEVIAVLNKNIEKADFVEESKVIRANAFKVGAPVGLDGRKYDFISVDPPYMASRDVSIDSPLGKLLVLLNEQLSPDGIVVVRTHKEVDLLSRYGWLEIIDRRQWGTMAVTILKKQNNDE